MPHERAATILRILAAHVAALRPRPLIVEVPALPWLSSLGSDPPVRLGNVPAPAWDRITRHAPDLVWLMGIWRRSTRGRAIALADAGVRSASAAALRDVTEDDLAGSPYCIAAYEPDPRIGSWDDVAIARQELSRRGAGLVLDFVPNHTAPDHPWLLDDPTLYVAGRDGDSPQESHELRRGGSVARVACGRDPYFPPWSDTAQLDAFNPATRRRLAATLADLAERCDGVRCDMAMLLLHDVFARTWSGRSPWPPPARELWRELRDAAPGLLLIAEAYWGTEQRLLDLGFDLTYDKETYDAIRGADVARLRERVALPPGVQQKLVRFLENHDEPRAEAALGPGLHRAAAILLATLPGLAFLHLGQESGRRIHVPVQLGRWPEERDAPDLEMHYELLMRLRRDPVIQEGTFSPIEPRGAFGDSAAPIVAFLWSRGAERRLVAVNLHDRMAQGFLPLEGAVDQRIHDLDDLLDGARYVRGGAEMTSPGLHVILGPHRGHLLAWR